MLVYRVFTRLPWPDSYVSKVALVAAVGAALPWALAGIAALAGWARFGLVPLLIATPVAALLVAGLVTALLAPVRDTGARLRRYLDTGARPALPAGYRDEIGRLMTDVGRTVGYLEELLAQSGRAELEDPLTGTLTRGAAEQRLQLELARALRTGQPFCVALVDLDRLKRINDEWGHQAGDRYIGAAAAVLKGSLRQSDWIARWGGDEFLIALWGSSERQAAFALQRTVEALSGLTVSGLDVSISASIGLARAREEDSLESLLERADRALYRAKQQGRDRVETVV